ncbi:ABC transporter ATP-binding protein [Chloroflexi bacterium CFX6]|nr:ABC transporter ATP-binding protein [Chloroflexi bacterium CFX6]
MTIVISGENLSKVYRLGQIGTGTFANDLKVWWARIRGESNPLLKIGEADHGNREGGEVWALKDVSFQVQQGEVLGIIGRNGAGKSTLLKVLSRITAPTSGQVRVKGRIASLLEVGTGFHPELTGRENTYLNGAILGMKREEITRKFGEIVDFAGVEKFIDTPVKRYSSGMYVRLAFAVAAHLEPEILVVDEVLAVGDVVFQKKCLGKMGDVAREGRTVLFVSHNMGAISNLCHSSMCLDGGRIVDLGDTESVIAAYVARSSANVPDDGYSDLQEKQRPSALKDRHAQFTFVRLTNIQDHQLSTFLEGEPITIEVGFSLERPVSHLQLGCGIATPDVYGELFTIPSPEYQEQFEPGVYSTKVRIDPNYLRDGTYRVTLKLFADGIRQDTIADTIQFSVIKRLSADDSNAYSRSWIFGRFRFDYNWSEIRTEESKILN